MDSSISRDLILIDYFFNRLVNKHTFFFLLYLLNAGHITLSELLIMAAAFSKGEENKEGDDVYL